MTFNKRYGVCRDKAALLGFDQALKAMKRGPVPDGVERLPRRRQFRDPPPRAVGR